MNKTVTCMGEMLIDMVQAGKERKLFEALPGGAPANVSVGVSRLGGSSAFIGKVGSDSFGHYLKNVLIENKVNVEGTKQSGRTGLAIVLLDNNGERNFEFYEQLTSYNKSDINYEVLDNTNIFHFGSTSLIGKTSRSATLQCLEYVKAKGISVSYDPNIRLNLWEDESSAKLGALTALGYADILKVSEEELEFLTDTKGLDEGLDKLLKMSHQLKFVAITLGNRGCYYYYNNHRQLIPTININVVDTTGAGDGFTAGLLYSFSNLANIEEMNYDEVERSVRFANIVGALVTTKKGAISALPFLDEVNRYFFK